jgi:cytochrome c oxidase subunit 3
MSDSIAQGASQAHAHEEHRDDVGSRLGMWLFLVTEIVLFGGLFLAYSYMRYLYPVEFHEAGQQLNVTIGVINTIILLTSSLTMVLSVVAIQRADVLKAKLLVGATIVMGAAFLVNKGFEWAAKFHHGLYPSSEHMATLPHGEQVFYSLYFSMTGLHGVHVLVGISVLTWVLARIMNGKINPGHYVLQENAGLYWHLVDVIWIYLLPLFYLAA